MPRRVMTGRVTSDKMTQTITVLVARRVMHPLYKKFIRRSKKYAAHDEASACKVGDTVRIEECRPISKRKTWLVIERNGEKLHVPEHLASMTPVPHTGTPHAGPAVQSDAPVAQTGGSVAETTSSPV